jgi:hypothetical protein
MATATKTAETPNAKIEITLTREVRDKVSWSDGWEIPMGREINEVYNIKIFAKKSGLTFTDHGKPGQYGFFTYQTSGKAAGRYLIAENVYVDKVVYDAAMALIAELDAELPKSEEQVAIETAERVRLKRSVAYTDTEPKHGENGYCRKCHSYCYGDCEANCRV